MAFIPELLLLSVAMRVAFSAQDIRLPPSITVGPYHIALYPNNGRVSLPCQAVGYPAPTFTWLKNGAILSESGVVRPDPTAGSIEIEQATKDHEGYYQCLVTNRYGSTMSNVTLLRVATLGSFDANTPRKNYTVQANDRLRVKCDPPQSRPSPEYSWSYNTTGLHQTDVILSKRLQVDFNGDLCFANVDNNEPTNRLFRCNVYNYVMSTTNSGGYSRIQVSGSITGAAPQLFFSSPSPYVALRSQQTKLRCFFSGSDNNGQGTITYSWTFNGKNILPPGWINSDVEARSPEFRTAASDAGRFVCFGRNSLGEASATIDLVVEAIPEFVTRDDQPHDMNVTEGKTVAIKCKPLAIPDANIRWYKDSVLLGQNTLPRKFSLSSDLTTLTISNVCKNCSNGTSDLMTIQCNASNVHGYAFVQGYVNVLLATKITSEPVTVTWSPNKNYQFDCAMTCDDSTKCTTLWTFEGRAIDDYSNRLFVDADGSLHIVTVNDTDRGSSRIGTYQCVVTNSYSEDAINATITGSAYVASAELWWVGLLVALLILLLLLIVLFCLFCCFCRDGRSYPVDRYEKKNGNDPVKELRDTGFQTYVQTRSPVIVAGNDYVTGDPVTNTFYVEDPGNDDILTSAPRPSQFQTVPGSPVSNNFYVGGPGNDYVLTSAPRPLQLQPVPVATGPYYAKDAVGIRIPRLSHTTTTTTTSQREVFTAADRDLWRPRDGLPYSEV